MSKTFQPRLATAFVSFALLGLSAPMFAAEPPPNTYIAGESNVIPDSKSITNGVVVGTDNHAGIAEPGKPVINNTTIVGSHNYAPRIYNSVIYGSQNVITPLNNLSHASGVQIIGNKNLGKGVIIGEDNMINYGSVALGESNSSLGSRSVTIGQGNSALDTDSISIGFGNYAVKTDTIAIGSDSHANEVGSISLGNQSISSVSSGVALGYRTLADRSGGKVGFASKTSTSPFINSHEAVAERLGKLEQYKDAQDKLKKTEAVRKVEKALYDAQQEVYKDRLAVNEAFKALKEIDPIKNKEGWTEAYNKFLAATKQANISSSARMKPFWDTQKEITPEEYKKQDEAYRTALAQYYDSINDYISTQGAVSVGNSQKGITRQIIGVAAGSENTDAVNLLQLKDAHQTMETTSPAVFVLDDGTPVYQSHVDGRYYKAGDMNAHNEPNSKDVQAVGTDQLTKRALTTADHDTRTAVGLTNVADGVADTDAVNVRQLKALQSGSNGAFQQMDRQVHDNTERLNRFDRKLNRGLAAQAALSGLHKPYNVNKVQVTAAMGFYRSSTAIALGAGYRPSNSVAVSAGLATSTKDTSDLTGNVAVSFELF